MTTVNMPRLRPHGLQVYAIDLLGFGDSDKALLDYSIELWRDLVVDFAQEFAGQPITVIGNSIGSLVALAATHKDSHNLRSTVLLNCAGMAFLCVQ
jgi:pimeloyl-ACP methyl ester carboxylesterase